MATATTKKEPSKGRLLSYSVEHWITLGYLNNNILCVLLVVIGLSKFAWKLTWTKIYHILLRNSEALVE